MRIEFNEEVPVAAEDVYAYFQTPTDWTRLYGAFGDVQDRGDGWYAVPLRRFPFRLVARMTIKEPAVRAAWEIRGFFRGRGEVRLHPTTAGTRVEGFEDLFVPHLLGLGPLVARRYIEPRFRKVWAHGWRRLRAVPSGR